MTTLMKHNDGSNLFPQLPSLFEDAWSNFMRWPFANGGDSETLPAVNIRETEKSYEISVAAPGMKKEDFNIQVDHNRLTISAARKEEKEDKKDGTYLRKEYSYQSFTRSFSLSERQVEKEKIQAKYVDGVLHLTIPKTAEAQKAQARVIPIS